MKITSGFFLCWSRTDVVLNGFRRHARLAPFFLGFGDSSRVEERQ